MKEKNDAMAAAEKCQNKMDLATRLVSALGSELIDGLNLLLISPNTLRSLLVMSFLLPPSSPMLVLSTNASEIELSTILLLSSERTISQ
jgi:hypothetical protein